MYGRSFNFIFLAALTIAGVAPQQSVAQEVIRIGAPLPLTGPLSPEGTKQKQGYDLWAEVANSKGGVKAGGKSYKVEIVYVDYASNTPRAVQTAERLITEDKVNFLFSPFGSGATKAASGVSEKYGIPTVAATASSEQVYDQGYKYLFGTFTPNDTLTEPLSAIVTKRDPNIKRVAILARNDLFPLAIGIEMEKSAKKRNLEVVMFEKYAIGTMDHASAITQMRAAKPDWIFATGYINDLILIRKQMSDLGVTAPIVTMIAGPAYKEFIDATGPLAENVSSAAWWHPAVRYDGKGVFGSTENFNKVWEQKYKDAPDYAQASAAAAGEIFQLAIEKANSIDPKQVRDALAALDGTTFYGRIKFGATGQITSLDPPVFQIQGGKPVVLFPDYVKQGELKTGVK
ncbi:MAG TPA: amino acid ABC transporter substrate-binding protein [Mesorhizobium sp.]|nr:amino acid ABC transporter substrate-binding protein [Mesorhizobium sp.]